MRASRVMRLGYCSTAPTHEQLVNINNMILHSPEYDTYHRLLLGGGRTPNKAILVNATPNSRTL